MNKSNNIDLNLIAVFCAVYKARSVTRAAEHIGVTQSAVSHSINKLRKQIGDPLFIKVSREMRPTQKAEILFDTIQRPLNELQDAVTPALRFDPETSKRIFTLAVSDYIETSLLPMLVCKLNQFAPNTSIQCIRINDFDLVETANRADLILGWFEQPPGNLHSRSLWRDSFTTIIAQAHPRITSNRMGLKQFLAEDHIVISPVGTGRSMVDGLLAEKKLKRRVKLRCRYFITPLKLVADSEMIATIPSRIAHTAASELALRCLKPPLKVPDFQVRMLWGPVVHFDPAHQWLRQNIIRWVTEA